MFKTKPNKKGNPMLLRRQTALAYTDKQKLKKKLKKKEIS